jgi:hypothetical protein
VKFLEHLLRDVASFKTEVASFDEEKFLSKVFADLGISSYEGKEDAPVVGRPVCRAPGRAGEPSACERSHGRAEHGHSPAGGAPRERGAAGKTC